MLTVLTAFSDSVYTWSQEAFNANSKVRACTIICKYIIAEMLNALTTRGAGVAAIEKGLHIKRRLYSKFGKIPWFSEL